MKGKTRGDYCPLIFFFFAKRVGISVSRGNARGKGSIRCGMTKGNPQTRGKSVGKRGEKQVRHLGENCGLGGGRFGIEGKFECMGGV